MSDSDPLARALAGGRPSAGLEQDTAMAHVVARLFGAHAAAPPRLARYQLGPQLGAGGHGIVYSAHDPKLDRDVAIKILRPTTTAQPQRAATIARMLQEGRALAQLSHPNVVEIYDVGRLPPEDGAHDGCFLVMERVDGTDLAAWLGERPRPTAEILDAFVQAGRGLAAAHRRGLVHRDFKPANVLIARDGGVKVTDLGLVRWMFPHRGSTYDTNPDPSDARPPSSLDAHALTRTGSIMGTPLYMAPEQHRGDPADARSDQYAFCVALFEALAGHPPYAAPTTQALAKAKQQPAPAPPPLASRAVSRSLLRGLHPDPAERHPDMESLLATMASRHHRTWVVPIATVTALVGLTGLGLFGPPAAHDSRLCEVDGEAFDAVWGPARAREVLQAFEHAGLPDAQRTLARLQPGLDHYADQWLRTHRAVCESLPSTPPDAGWHAAADGPRTCLEDRAVELHSLLTMLEHADRASIGRGLPGLATLPPPNHCAHARGHDPRPPALADAIRSRRAQLAEAGAHRRAGQWDAGITIALAVVESREALADASLRIGATITLATLNEGAGHYDDARTLLERAYAEAVELDHDRLASYAARQLIAIVGVRRGSLDEALQWARHAEAAARRAPPDALEDARRLLLVGQAHGVAGQLEAAADALQQSMRIRMQARGEDHLEVGRVMAALAYVESRMSRFTEAHAHFTRALAITERLLGPDHFKVAQTLVNRAQLWQTQGRLDEGFADAQRALAIYRRVLAPEDPAIALALNVIGTIAYDQGHLERAAQYYEQAYTARLANPETTDRSLGQSLMNLGSIEFTRRNFTRARDSFSKARVHLEHAVGSEHVVVSYPCLGLGLAFTELGRPAEAIPYLERALALRQAGPSPQVQIAEAELALALALLADDPRTRPRAFRLARHAHAVYSAGGEGFDHQRGEAEAWLRYHGGLVDDPRDTP